MSSNVLTASTKRCFLAVDCQRCRKSSNHGQWISQELGPDGVPPLDGGRFRRMEDIFFVSFMGWGSRRKVVRRLV